MQIHHGHIFSLILACFFTIDCFAEEPGVCINTDEAELLQLVDDYRVENELPTVAWSQSLMTVGQWHAVDAATNGDTIFEGECNLHSWSDDHPELWTGMCYTPDHAQAEFMWSKPEEITAGVYTAAGFENAAWGYTSVAAALDAWKNSPGHNDVILNNGVWRRYPWLAMGVGVDLVEKYYFLWFSTMSDPLGDMPLCSTNSPPTQPGTLSASAITENSATVSWDASTDADDDPISYQVEYRRNGDVSWVDDGSTSTTSRSLSGLDSAQAYDVRVTPSDATDAGPARTTPNLFETDSLNSPPTQPGTLSASAITENSATVSWGASTDADDDPITYLVEYQPNGGASWISAGNTNTTSRPLSGLDSAQAYDVRVTPSDPTDAGPARTTPNLFETLNDDSVFTDSFE